MTTTKAGKKKSLIIMQRLEIGWAVFLLILGLTACGTGTEEEKPSAIDNRINTLSSNEKAEGWILLFNGLDFEGWRGLGRESIPEGHWTVENGFLKKIPSGDVPLQEDGQPVEGGDILTEETFEDFDLRFEWKICPGGNSGIKYNVSESMSVSFPPEFAALGFEYQILDDNGHPDAQNGANRTAAALYDISAPGNKNLKPVGEWNSGRIFFKGNHGEHWLNGQKVLEFDLDTPEMEKRLKASKYSIYEGYGLKRKGHIVIQDHTDAAWYRNIKIKIL
jgi:hypothetical protein